MAAREKLVVVGGGAAGFFCAVNAARLHPGLEVVIIEKSNKVLSKVKVSGGGRCNVTHACFDIDEMSKRYPRDTHFVRKAFHQFFTTDTIQWFEERGVKLKTEADGRMFPVTDNSQSVIDCLLREANKYNVQLLMQAEVRTVKHVGRQFKIENTGSRELNADYLCIACGGYPKTAMFDWLREPGHTIEEPVPSLFTFNMPGHPITELMGVSATRARVKIAGTKLTEEGPVLITHWGLSGPAILKLSAWGARELASMNYHFTAHINWLQQEDHNEQSLRELVEDCRRHKASLRVHSYHFASIPQRLWLFLLAQAGINKDMRWADLPKKAANALVKNLVDYPVEIKGKTTFKEEFVTAGGIRLSEVDANTMMSRKIPQLYFAGEILDVDGITGGYNFQHAWTSGFIAAQLQGS